MSDSNQFPLKMELIDDGLNFSCEKKIYVNRLELVGILHTSIYKIPSGSFVLQLVRSCEHNIDISSPFKWKVNLLLIYTSSTYEATFFNKVVFIATWRLDC